jgi:hypothetical protein
MHIDIRPVAKLRDPGTVNVPAALGPLFDALTSEAPVAETPVAETPVADTPIAETRDGTAVDLARLRVVCDWIQYRNNFSEPIHCRPVLAERPHGPGIGDPRAAETALEIALDLRRCDDPEMATTIKAALAGHLNLANPARTILEPWVPTSESCIWRFNTLYWQALKRWEQATGREYEQALPGGRSDARNTETVRELILELFRVWDELDARRALPEELYVVELGVGNGNQARTWLDVFAAVDRAHGRDYFRRLHYLMGDYSAHVLERARQTVGQYCDRVNALVLDATRPQLTLGFLRGKAFGVYVSNVYDNLPTDEVASIQGRPYLVEVRAYVRDQDAAAIASRHNIPADTLGTLTERLLRLGPDLLAEAAPEHFPDVDHAVSLWREVWTALRLQERYVPLEGLDDYRVSPSLTGEILRPLLGSSGDIRMHVSNGALASFTDTLPLLHPFGRLLSHDLFLTEPGQYHAGFYGPGKYDGSVVNWVNGPLLQLIGNRRGFDVQIAPLRGRPAATVKTLTAQVRD